MRKRFGKTHPLNFVILFLLAILLCNGNHITFDDLLSFYKEDLSTSFLARSELMRWRAKWEGQADSNQGM